MIWYVYIALLSGSINPVKVKVAYCSYPFSLQGGGGAGKLQNLLMGELSHFKL